MAADTLPEATNLGLEETPETAETETSGGKGRKLLVFVGLFLALLGGAGVSFSQFAQIDRAAQALRGGDGETEEDEPIEYGEFVQIDGLVVNPAGTGGARYLMVSIGLEAADAAVLEEVGTKDIVVRDAIISHLSGKTIETLADISNRDGIKEEIRALINEIVSEGEIDRLYFTQFMLQ
jgi:flagellar FliL protein